MSNSTPFHKILIANRGEIALRVMRSARALGYRTVAVFSSADRNARHVREADQAVWIGESLPAQSYLNIPAIIEAARRTGADAAHPGYGFLAENEDFAQACRDAGLVFIGPSPQAIVAMGNKAGAKQLMMQAGVPCIPGYQGEDQSDARLHEEARRIGYPVMIKATAGGGGRGMRLVSDDAQFLDALRSAKSEAQSAFGNPEVILERAIIEPRHIEIQVFADRHGNAIHLGERDCSVQRRHQKVVEEAPSPAVDADLRRRMGETAVAAVKAIGYEGAGTLEFLLDREGNFYFMEMNTRLQVEHPVTEAITGLDLVELQLRVAAGEPLPIRQEDVRFDGHAIEVRLCAEDPSQGFMPQSGVMSRWEMPAAIRVEHALESGSEIPPYYDSMIAKLIAHGRTRDEARRKLHAALQDAVALGVRTNQAFLARCLAHPVFAAGGATTAFIGQHGEELLRDDEDDRLRARAIAAVLLACTAQERHGALGPQMAHRLPVTYHLEADGQACEVVLAHEGGARYGAALGERRFEVQVLELGPNAVRLSFDGIVESARYVRAGDALQLHYRGVAYATVDRTREARSKGGAASDGRIRAAMNGRVVAVHVAVGDTVKAGQPVMTLDAMKMEHIHAAPVNGRVKSLAAAMGDQVAVHRVIAEIEAEQSQAEESQAA
ncbi:acetyl-CoA carboxylase biotin carboxylase subunit [Caldimonas thermodepolymerans]|uniref:acetyl-CoA carboxylase biotin carboxylase subunit n=1 Tax=Caldimonas thermodepolymerans TaxID=215580 RepID=UPI0022362266|nr:acetyl-CoA carboxylase biotin carboxylase subunit [Caldimonas thermodepolymerans]UZG44956.1 acetyl-CoA carboxylase biotin carboxylase subunit [Caldimonas thermodepolymerans]